MFFRDPFDVHTPDLYLPYFTILEFISYMGWIKVAETLLNPFGEDDEDFQINYLIDRNVQAILLLCCFLFTKSLGSTA